MEVREKKMPGRHQELKNVLDRGSNKFQENCGTLFGEQCRNGMGGGSHVTVLQTQRGEPRLLPEQTVWSVQDSEQRPSKGKRPKAKTNPVTHGVVNIQSLILRTHSALWKGPVLRRTAFTLNCTA